MALSDVKIRSAKPVTKPQRLWDSGGLYLEVTPSGGKLWRFKYRFQGKEKLLALGKWPIISLRDARTARDDAKRLLTSGTDPGAARRQAKIDDAVNAADSFKSVALEWFDKQVHVWTDRHAADVKRRLDRNLFPPLGGRPIADIAGKEILEALLPIEARGSPDMAHRMLQVASQVFRYGVATGRCERDPAPDLRGALMPHRSKNQAAVRPEEVPELLRAIGRYEEVGDRQTQLALLLLAHTFVRTGELIGAEWSEFDIEGPMPVWIVPAARMKMRTEHVVPLSRQAIAILEQLRALSGGSHFVLPGRNPNKPISNNTMLFALYRLGYKRRMTGHGFRAIASTLLNEAGFRPDVIERQLAHCERNDVRGAYNRAEYLDERRDMMQRYSDMLDNLVRGSRVVPLQRASKGRV
jgi:integrase